MNDLNRAKSILRNRSFPKGVLGGFWSVIFACGIATSLCRDDAKTNTSSNSIDFQLARNVTILKHLDAGNLTEARRELISDSMFRIFSVLQSIQYTTNKDVLSGIPELRAAAKYWGTTNLPADPEIWMLSDSTASNAIHRALGIVRTEIDKRLIESGKNIKRAKEAQSQK